MKKLALMLASVMMAGALVGVCACGPNSSGDDGKIEGHYTEATEQDIANKAGSIDLLTALVGSDPDSWTIGAKAQEKLDVDGKIDLTIGDVVWPLQAKLGEELNYFVNVAYNSDEGTSFEGTGSAKVSLEGKGPTYGVEYLKYLLSMMDPDQDPDANIDVDPPELPETGTAPTTDVKANVETNVYTVVGGDDAKLYAELKTAKYKFGTEAEQDLIGKGGLFDGASKFFVDMGGFDVEETYSAQQVAADGPASLYNLGSILVMVKQLGGKVYFDASNGLKVKVSFQLVDLIKGIYSFAQGEEYDVEEEEDDLLLAMLDSVKFSKQTVEVYLQLDSNNNLKQIGLDLDVGVTSMTLDFSGEDETFIISGSGSLSLSLSVEKTNDKVTAPTDLSSYKNIEDIIGFEDQAEMAPDPEFVG